MKDIAVDSATVRLWLWWSEFWSCYKVSMLSIAKWRF